MPPPTAAAKNATPTAKLGTTKPRPIPSSTSSGHPVLFAATHALLDIRAETLAAAAESILTAQGLGIGVASARMAQCLPFSKASPASLVSVMLNVRL